MVSEGGKEESKRRSEEKMEKGCSKKRRTLEVYPGAEAVTLYVPGSRRRQKSPNWALETSWSRPATSVSQKEVTEGSYRRRGRRRGGGGGQIGDWSHRTQVGERKREQNGVENEDRRRVWDEGVGRGCGKRVWEDYQKSRRWRCQLRSTSLEQIPGCQCVPWINTTERMQLGYSR